jgi:photosystem II stability/assembly factor-like uncharacterized protein
MNESVFLATNGNGLARAVSHNSGEWSVESLLQGQPISCLAADPLHEAVVYAGSESGGVLRSQDRGLTWQSAGLSGSTVKSIAVSRSDCNAIYAGTKPAGLFVSRDEGTTWNELDAFQKIPSRRFWFSPAEAPYSAYVQGIALSPCNSDLIVAGIEAGAVVRSTDRGQTWTDHPRGAVRDCHTIRFHDADGNWVFEAGGSGKGVAFSRDAGETWTQPKTGLDRHYGWACAADPAQPYVWYVSVSTSPFKAHGANDAQAYIFRSIGGTTWQKLGGGLPQPLNHMPYALITDPAAPGHVYAGLSNGDVWHSTDQGDHWQRLPFNLKSIHRSLIRL